MSEVNCVDCRRGISCPDWDQDGRCKAGIEKTVTISIKDCKYYLDYDKIKDYPYAGEGDCDHIENNEGCYPCFCPIKIRGSEGTITSVDSDGGRTTIKENRE